MKAVNIRSNYSCSSIYSTGFYVNDLFELEGMFDNILSLLIWKDGGPLDMH